MKNVFAMEISPTLDPDLSNQFPVRPNDSGGEFYEPPVSFDLLTKMLRMAPAHEQALDKKHALVCGGLVIKKPKKLPSVELKKAIRDFLIYGNFFLESTSKGLRHRNARLIRKARPGELNNREWVKVLNGNPEETVTFGKMLHGKEYAPESAIYGLPGYLSATEDILTSYLARKRRRVSYQQGSNGELLVINIDPELKTNEEGELAPGEAYQELMKTLSETKNKRSGGTALFNVNDPRIEDLKKRVHSVSVGVPLEKDGYDVTTTETRVSILNAHGIHPELLGVLTGERNSSQNFDRLYELTKQTVIEPLQQTLVDLINEFSAGLLEVRNPGEDSAES